MPLQLLLKKSHQEPSCEKDFRFLIALRHNQGPMMSIIFIFTVFKGPHRNLRNENEIPAQKQMDLALILCTFKSMIK